MLLSKLDTPTPLQEVSPRQAPTAKGKSPVGSDASGHAASMDAAIIGSIHMLIEVSSWGRHTSVCAVGSMQVGLAQERVAIFVPQPST